MNISEPLRDLGPVDIDALVREVERLTDNDWRAQTMRQDDFAVHHQTESVVLSFLDTNRWPDVVVNREYGWDLLADTAVPLMDEILERYYRPGGTILRAMLAKLPADGLIAPHVDKHHSFHMAHRIHVPVSTNERVRFMIDGRPYQLLPGNAYELNNQKLHSVMNKGDTDRVTLIFDYLPP